MATWYNCDVIAAGPAADDLKVHIRLRDKAGAFDSTWFEANPAQQKEMLATALTAITTRFSVSAVLDATTEGSQLIKLYVQVE
jgi:hypothetical protein